MPSPVSASELDDRDAPFPGLGAAQRSRVRLTGAAVTVMALTATFFIVGDVLAEGPSVAFGQRALVAISFDVLGAAVLLSPLAWSAFFRASRFGVRIDGDELVVESWLRTRRFHRSVLSAAEPFPAKNQWRDGWFSAREAAGAQFSLWLWPQEAARDAFQLGVTTANWDDTAAAARRINAWLGADVDIRYRWVDV